MAETPELTPEQEALLEKYRERYSRDIASRKLADDKKPLRFTKRDRYIISEIKNAAETYRVRMGRRFRVAFDMGRVLVMRGQFVKGKFIDIPRKYYHYSPPRDGMIRLIKLLVAALGKDGVILLKGLPAPSELVNVELDVKAQCNMWIVFHKFCEQTGFDHSNLIFAERDKKREVCQQRGVTCIVDDRGEVLQNFPTTMLNLAFSPVKEEWEKYPEAARRSIIIRRPREIWMQICRYLLRTAPDLRPVRVRNH